MLAFRSCSNCAPLYVSRCARVQPRVRPRCLTPTSMLEPRLELELIFSLLFSFKTSIPPAVKSHRFAQTKPRVPKNQEPENQTPPMERNTTHPTPTRTLSSHTRRDALARPRRRVAHDRARARAREASRGDGGRALGGGAGRRGRLRRGGRGGGSERG